VDFVLFFLLVWYNVKKRSDVGIDPYGHKTATQPFSNIVRSIKVLLAKEIGQSIFQHSYYDHVIRNQRDYNEIWEYIEDNPRKWVIQNQGYE